ncbi:hypothetical protein B5P46_28705 [Rhizobium leguminosarum]|uniref:Uncharacterized protein n=2 Tax=Rhizobium leguminosarum TaxID=384 RepID=A0A4Q1THJ4_RHILE|nr:hypothetical protein B5P46_28705 [Rhizobium leguminosarum]
MVTKFLLGLSIALARALFQTFNGVVIATAFSWMLVGIGGLVGIGLQIIFDRFGLKLFTGLGLAFFFIFFLLSILALVLMFIGRFIHAAEDVDVSDQAFDILFMGYGMFATLVIMQIYSYHKFDGSIFTQRNIGLLDIVWYVLHLTFLGFIPDVLQYSPLSPSLSAVGIMKVVEFILKIIMAATVISGTFRYLDARHKIVIFPF